MYAAVPPFTVKSILPFALPQVVFVCVVERTSGVGSITVALAVTVHPFASVTVTVYVPAATLVKFCVTAALLHT